MKLRQDNSHRKGGVCELSMSEIQASLIGDLLIETWIMNIYKEFLQATPGLDEGLFLGTQQGVDGLGDARRPCNGILRGEGRGGLQGAREWRGGKRRDGTKLDSSPNPVKVLLF